MDAKPQADSVKRQSSSFPMIDVLRGFAALSVVVYHVIEHFHWTSFPTSGVLTWFRNGWMGVDLFFVISGFVITLSAFNGLDNLDVPQFRSSFARRRLARIAPLHYLTCFVFLILVLPDLLFTRGIWSQIATHLLFVHNLILTHWGAINGVNWSIATEMQFYVLILITAPWLRRRSWWLIALAGLTISWAWRAAAFELTNTTGTWGVMPLVIAQSQLPGMLDEFTIGILLTFFIRSEPGRRFLDGAKRVPWVLPCLSALLLWIMLSAYWRNGTYWDSVLMVVPFRSFMGLTWASCVLCAVSLNGTVLLRLTAPLRYLGTISYGIYLWHLSVILSLKRIPWETGPAVLPYVLILTVSLAAISWHCFEHPFLVRFATKRFQGVTPRSSVRTIALEPELGLSPGELGTPTLSPTSRLS